MKSPLCACLDPPEWRGLLLALLTLLPLACALRDVRTSYTGTPSAQSGLTIQQCLSSADRCDDGGDTSGSGGPAQVPTAVAPAQTPAPPAPCERLCERIKQTYHDSRTQDLLMLLAQTPTGQEALEYLLAMGARLGDGFITWRDLGADGHAGENNAGGSSSSTAHC